ncbi:hypothetical protein NL676_033980 [Syzygium grande]|nr:hypothetical protein NL676_033980 [Syzygium grande]
MQSALMGLETLASSFVVWVVLSDFCEYLWEKYTGEAEPDPDMLVEKLALALVVWVVVSALHSRIRRRNSGLAKLMQSAVIVLGYTFILWEFDMEEVAVAYIIWLAISVLGLPLWIEVTGGTEHLREWGMGLFGHFALLDPSIFTYARVTAVWIILYAFYSECERLVWDGTDTAPKEVASSLSISTLAKKEFRVFLSVNRGPDVHQMKGTDGQTIRAWGRALREMPQLKILNLTGCTGLLMTPDLSGFEKLEILILEHCSRLVKIDASIAYLKCLVTLNLKFCSELSMLPKELNDMKEMKELLIDGTSIKEIPSTLANMKKLKSLSASNCFSLSRLPESISLLKDLSVLLLDSIQSLCCLQTLDLLHCDRIELLPILPSSLTHLHVISRNMKVVPFIDHLTKIEELCLGDEYPEELELPSAQRMMNSILTREAVTSFLWPKRFPRLKVLELSHSRITDIRLRDECLPQITKLAVSGANLRRVPQLPSTLSFLSVRGCLSLKRLPTIQCLKSLTELRLSRSAIREVEGLGELEALEIIDISHCEHGVLTGSTS